MRSAPTRIATDQLNIDTIDGRSFSFFFSLPYRPATRSLIERARKITPERDERWEEEKKIGEGGGGGGVESVEIERGGELLMKHFEKYKDKVYTI